MTKLLPCPFCGSTNIDPKGWASTDRSGPACDDCAGTADTVEIWNARTVPVGWKLVPIEPTPAMIDAGEMFADGHPEKVWRDMIDAA